jgi:hypothetical protein
LKGLSADPALVGIYQTEAIPTAAAALLGKASSIRSAGARKIDGVWTTRYVGSIDIAAALPLLTPPVRALLAPELTSVTGSMRFVVWIDGQHNVRELQTSARVAGLSTVTTVVVKAFNPAMHIAVPDSSLVSALTPTH